MSKHGQQEFSQLVINLPSPLVVRASVPIGNSLGPHAGDLDGNVDKANVIIDYILFKKVEVVPLNVDFRQPCELYCGGYQLGLRSVL
jgi:hypothetical protein